MTDANLPEENLRRALRDLAAADVAAALDRARARARDRAERLIEEALVEELLDAAARLRGSVDNRSTSDAHEGASIDEEARTSPVAPPEGGSPVNEAHCPAPPAEAVNGDLAGEDHGPADPADHGQAWWAYCVMSSHDAAQLALGLDGVDPGHPVEAVSDGELAALVSQVPLTEYGDEQLRAHLEDLEWIERTARRHETVLETALREASIVPLRLCTLYHDQEGVRRLLREHWVDLRKCLSFVDGCVEWGAKVFVDPSAGTRAASAQVPDSGAPGASYLLRRQRERALAEKASEVHARCVEVVENRVGALARFSTANPPQRPEAHGRDLTMLLNGAYLVRRDRTTELQQALRTLQEEWQPLGFTIELTGPWPPYNFVSGAAGVSS